MHQPRQSDAPIRSAPRAWAVCARERFRRLQRIEFNDRREEIRRETLLRELNQRIRDVREGPDGLLHVLTAESPDGAVVRIERAN